MDAPWPLEGLFLHGELCFLTGIKVGRNHKTPNACMEKERPQLL
jgi:hypothetical protein